MKVGRKRSQHTRTRMMRTFQSHCGGDQQVCWWICCAAEMRRDRVVSICASTFYTVGSGQLEAAFLRFT